MGNKSDEKRQQHQCATCGMMFGFRSHLEHHLNTHSGPTEHKCHLCGKSFAWQHTLDRHAVEHRKLPCSMCGEKFGSGQKLAEHMQIHPGVKEYPCVLCGKSFAQKCHLEEHSHAVHSTRNGEKKFPCTICDMKFKLEASLDQHMELHAGDREHQCSQCRRSFSRKDHLEQHVVTVHTKKNKYACTICDKKFALKLRLVLHMKTHSDTEHNCSHCDKSFAKKRNLKQHVTVVHTKEIKFQCTKCDKKYRWKSRLERHCLETHNIALKEHQCEECGKRFDNKSNLKRHFSILHKQYKIQNKKTLYCWICREECIFTSSLVDQYKPQNMGFRYTCPKCVEHPAVTHEALRLQNHVKQHIPCAKEGSSLKEKTTDTTLRCWICGLEPGFKSSLVDQFKPQEMGFRYTCPQCDVNLESASNLGDYFQTFSGMLESTFRFKV